MSNLSDEKIRELIYKRLGLPFGSLSSESGNDWVRAKAEVEAEINEELNARLNNAKADNDISDSSFNESEILDLIQKERLDSEKILEFINMQKKDILISLAKFQTLNEFHIDSMIDNAPYLAVKHIIQRQSLSPDNREKILQKLNKTPQIYKELIQDAKGLKW